MLLKESIFSVLRTIFIIILLTFAALWFSHDLIEIIFIPLKNILIKENEKD